MDWSISLQFIILTLNFVNSFDVNYFDDNILFQITTDTRDVLDNRLGEKGARELIPIVSADDEKYFCMIPDIASQKKNPITDYTGPAPAELLTSIYNEKFCSLRIEPYWRYELCHGKYLRQYHDDKDAKVTAEYYLGSYPKDKNEATPEFDFTKPPLKEFDGKILPYYPVNYIHGTHCDLTGQPRRTTVIYICANDQPRSFQSITEIKSCVYEAVVAVKELCSHPAFKKDEPVPNEIQCFASEGVKNPIPKSLLKFQNEIKALPMLPLKSDRGPLTQRVPAQYINKEIQDLFKNTDALKQIKELKNLLNAVKKPKSEENLLTAFWTGKACLYGGSGYWRYEFCYNRQVSQFHEEDDGKITRINLGYHNPKLHKEWVSETGVEPRKIENGRVTQISTLYSRGDLCPEMKTLRKCEVRMKCRPVSSKDEDPSSINMYLVEPDKCSYILLIETALICDKIQAADELGQLLVEAAHADEKISIPSPSLKEFLGEDLDENLGENLDNGEN